MVAAGICTVEAIWSLCNEHQAWQFLTRVPKAPWISMLFKLLLEEMSMKVKSTAPEQQTSQYHFYLASEYVLVTFLVDHTQVLEHLWAGLWEVWTTKLNITCSPRSLATTCLRSPRMLVPFASATTFYTTRLTSGMEPKSCSLSSSRSAPKYIRCRHTQNTDHLWSHFWCTKANKLSIQQCSHFLRWHRCAGHTPPHTHTCIGFLFFHILCCPLELSPPLEWLLCYLHSCFYWDGQC